MEEKESFDLTEEQAQDRIIEIEGNNYYLLDDSQHAMPAVRTKKGWHAEGNALRLGRR